MTSAVQICNTALARIGSSIFISSLDEASNQANVCNLFYEQCRDQVLQQFPWKFARKTVQLQVMATDVVGWEYAYAYPNDCVAALWLKAEDGSWNGNDRFEFDVVYNETNKLIVCNQPDMYLEYTSLVESASRFSPSFASALSWLVASEIAAPLAADPKLAASCYQSYQATVTAALADSLNEGYEGKIQDSELVTVRN